MNEAIPKIVDESSFIRLDSDEESKFDEHDSTILNFTLSSSKIINETPTKIYVALLSENDRTRRDISTLLRDQEMTLIIKS